MRTLFYDGDFKCHTVNDGTMTPFETELFDGKCDSYVEGHLFVPSGKSWTRSDGKIFYGEMISSWKDYAELDSVQREYERQQLIALQNKENSLISSYIDGINSI
jgi:hypothetical protein